jgi:adenylate cyclase
LVTETLPQRLIRNEVYKVPEALALETIRSAVDRAVESPQLDSCPSLCRFLRYVVEETLAGRGANIKEYSLGLEVFHRGESFDPRLDPIVRVQARNLRIRLARYYAGPGANHPIRIELPKRTYVPVFHSLRIDQIHQPRDLSRAMLMA